MADIPATRRRRRAAGEGRARAVRDPNCPKRPTTPYFMWAGKNRSKFVEASGSSKPAAVAAYAKQQWQQVSASKKEKWNAKYAEEMEEWKAKMVEYKQTSGYAEFKASQQAAKEARSQQTGTSEAGARGSGAKRRVLESCTDEELLGELKRRLTGNLASAVQTGTVGAKPCEIEGEGTSETGGTTTSSSSTASTSAGPSSPTGNATTESMSSGSKYTVKSGETKGFLAYLEAKRAKWEKAGGGPEVAFKLNACKRWNNLSEEIRERWEDSVAD